MGQTDLLREAKREMDEMMAGVMPESWLGHARLAIYDSDLSGKQEEFALKLAERVGSKNEGVPANKVAESAIKKTREKMA